MKLNGTYTGGGEYFAIISNLNTKLVGTKTLYFKLISGSASGATSRLAINDSYAVSPSSTTARIFSWLWNASTTEYIETLTNLDTTMEYFSIYVNRGMVFNNAIFSIQIEDGSTATNYIEHEGETHPLTLGNIELCEIGDYKDSIYKNYENGKWYLHKEIGKSVFDGSEDEGWKMELLSNSRVNFYVSVLTALGVRLQPILNNLGKYSTSLQNNYDCYINGTNLNFLNNNWTSISDLRTALSQTNMIVLYRLATPTDTEITDTTLIAQLEALLKAKTYKKITNITNTGADLAPVLDIVYKKDLETLFNNLSNS